jgi:hypothetical protein
VSVSGRHLVQLLARLDQLEIELIQMAQWLDRLDEPGNSRTTSLIDTAAMHVGAAARQVMRDKAAGDALIAARADVQGQGGYGSG